MGVFSFRQIQYPVSTVWAEDSFVDARLTRQVFPQGAESSEIPKVKDPDSILSMFHSQLRVYIHIYLDRYPASCIQHGNIPMRDPHPLSMTPPLPPAPSAGGQT